MKIVIFVTLLSFGSLRVLAANVLTVGADTTSPGTTRQHPVQAIMPGYRLDTSSSSLAAPDSGVYRVVPNWLRAKATGKPVYVIDGQVASASQLKNLEARSVESVNVIDGKRAAALYGAVARNGVVTITTKAALLQGKN